MQAQQAGATAFLLAVRASSVFNCMDARVSSGADLAAAEYRCTYEAFYAKGANKRIRSRDLLSRALPVLSPT